MRAFAGDILPSNITLPAVGRITPVMRLKIVVLPAPLGPIKPYYMALFDGHAELADSRQPAEILGQFATSRSTAYHLFSRAVTFPFS